MTSRIVALTAAVLMSASTLCPAQQPAPAPYVPAGDAGPDTVAARALLDSFKGEIGPLEEARKRLEAAWKLDRTNPELKKEFDRYMVVRKEMYAIQRKTRGGPGVAEARALLDAWGTRPDALARAKEALDRVVAVDPYNAYVPIEMARLQMNEGYINNRPMKNKRFVYSVGNYQPGVLQKAAQTVYNGLRYDPQNADVYVMQGRIFYESNSLDAAEIALTRGDKEGATDPRRHMYWADVLVGRGSYAAAAERVQRALKEVPGDARVALMAQTRLAEIYKRSEEPAKAIAAHEALVKMEPDSAWIHGNYAAYLVEIGRYDQAIVEARKALKIADYGIGRMNLAHALYGKWGDQLAERKPDAEATFQEARKLWPDLDSVMLCCAPRPTSERLVKALLSKGVSIDTRAEDGSTPLLIAANRNSSGAVKFLLDLKANPNIPDKNGWTPLLSAAADGNGEIVQLLLAKGADTKAMLNGKDAAAIAEQNGYAELAASLKKRGQ